VNIFIKIFSNESYDLLKQVCSSLAYKAIKLLEIKYMKNGNEIVKEELVENYLKDIKEEHVMLKIFNEIFKSFKDENENIDKSLRDSNLEALLNNFKNNVEYDLSRDLINKVSKNERFIRPLLDIFSENNVLKRDIKVLEINLSNAIMALETDHYLASNQIYPINVDYTIAHNSIEKLHEDYKNKSFKLIEWDHKKTSFPSGISTMDLIIFRDSQELFHLKIDEFLREIYEKIANKGFLLSLFRCKLTEPELALNHIYDNNNNSTNNSNFSKRIDEFRTTATKIGLNVICRKTDSIGSIAILFRKVIPNDRIRAEDNIIIEINDNYNKWLDVLKEKVNENIENKKTDNEMKNIWLIANDSSINGIIGLTNCLRQEPGGERIRCIFDYDKQMKLPPDFSSKPFSDILTNDLAINVMRDGKLGTYRHLRVPKNHDKVESNDYFLNIGPNGDLSSLQWFDSKNIAKNKIFVNIDNRKIPQTRCNIYSTGINFRDVMLASGIYSVILNLLSQRRERFDII
jgi:fatty acid synthase